jgi:hypothetical protein
MAKPEYNNKNYQELRRRFLADSPVCHWCHKAKADTIDHLIEVDRGIADPNDTSLWVGACRPCNSKRGQKYQTQKNQQNKTARARAMAKPFLDRPHQDPAAQPAISLERNETGTGELENILARTDENGLILPRLVTPSWGQPSYEPEVSAWAERNLSLSLMPWQKLAISQMLEYHTDDGDGHKAGDLCHRTSLCSVARQNGKTTSLLAVIGWALTVWPVHRGGPVTVISTAHNLNLAEALFHQLAPILEASFEAEAYWSSGRMSLKLPDGSYWGVQAARPASFHGRSPTLVIADEIWAIQESIIADGAVPAQRAQRSPLLSMWSTAGTEDSKLFQRYRTQGLKAIDKGVPGTLHMAEWSPSPDANPNLIETIKQANPALGHTITLETLQEEARDPANRTAWLRGALNMWVATAEGWLQSGYWARQLYDGPKPDNPLVLAVEVDPDGGLYAGVFGYQLTDGGVYVSQAFVASTAEEMWQIIADILPATCGLIVGASLELAIPQSLRKRAQIAGFGEVTKWTMPVKAMILEGRLWHDGAQMLSEHCARAVAVRTNGGNNTTLSTKRSPGPIVLTRAMIWAAAICTQKRAPNKTMIVAATRK